MKMNKDTKVSWSVVAGFLGLTLLGVSLSLNGCAAADSREATTDPTSKAQMTNSELEEEIKARFKTDAQLDAANLSVDANVNRNEITLSGTVGWESLRTKARELAKSADGVKSVNKQLKVGRATARAPEKKS